MAQETREKVSRIIAVVVVAVAASWLVFTSPLRDKLWLPAILFIVIAGTLLLDFGKSGEKSTPDFGKTLFEAYEEGKHRRYTLLFAVNGGAFAVVKLLVEKQMTDRPLAVRDIACGMIFFTAIMCFDILAFGLKMRSAWRNSLPDRRLASSWDGLFAWPGWIVLGALWLLISAGWSMAGAGRQETRDQTRDQMRSTSPNLGPQPDVTAGAVPRG